MTPEQYWDMDCQLVKAYREAYELRQEIENQNAWIQGMYIYEVLVDMVPALRAFGAKKPTPYRNKPFELYAKSRSETGKKMSEEEISLKKAEAWMDAFMTQFNQKFEGGGGNSG